LRDDVDAGGEAALHETLPDFTGFFFRAGGVRTIRLSVI
jgi:hypothetical protein